MNSVHLIGRLATDVDLKEIEGGSKVSSFILAVDRNAEEADFFRIKAWNSQAEAAGDHLGKGRRIAVEGSLRQDVYEKDGEERKAVSVVANCGVAQRSDRVLLSDQIALPVPLATSRICGFSRHRAQPCPHSNPAPRNNYPSTVCV